MFLEIQFTLEFEKRISISRATQESLKTKVQRGGREGEREGKGGRRGGEGERRETREAGDGEGEGENVFSFFPGQRRVPPLVIIIIIYTKFEKRLFVCFFVRSLHLDQ